MEGQPGEGNQDLPGLRRSTRRNFGQPPNHYGDWVYEMPQDLLTSTQNDGAGGNPDVDPGQVSRVRDDDEVSLSSLDPDDLMNPGVAAFGNVKFPRWSA